MRFVPGPDLPTGGKIVGLDGIRDAYETGRGIFRTRATARIEKITPRRTGIVVTELPYGVGPEKVIARIKDLVQAKKLTGISDLKDLTDRHHGLQLVIEIRNGFHPEAVLDELYRLTPMEETFGINNVALVDGQPRVLGLRELLQIYVDHRIEVVRRRSEYRRRKRADRLHLVDGLVIALLNIDEVIQVIRTSDDAAAAKERLMSVFDLTAIQAQYILDTPLRRLTRYDRLELERERETLQAEIAELTAILESRRTAARAGLQRAGQRGRAVRRPRAGRSCWRAAARPGPLPCRWRWPTTRAWCCCPRPGWWPGPPPQPAEGQDHGETGPGTAAARPGTAPRPRAAHDAIVASVPSTARGTIAVVTSLGRLIRLGVLEIPALPPSAHSPSLAGGAPVGEFVPLAPGETVVGLAAADAAGAGLALGTASGVVKRVAPDYPASATEFDVIALKDGDRVVGAVQLTSEDQDLVFITSDAQLLRFGASAVRPQGRAAAGMAGIRLAARASVIWFGAVDTGQGGQRRRRCPGLPGRRAGGRGGRRDRGRHRRGAAGHRRGDREGDPVHGVPGEGPCDRRGAMPPAPQGRGRARARLGRASARTRRDRRRGAGGPAAGRRPPGRLRHPGTPAPGRPGRPGTARLTAQPALRGGLAGRGLAGRGRGRAGRGRGGTSGGDGGGQGGYEVAGLGLRRIAELPPAGDGHALWPGVEDVAAEAAGAAQQRQVPVVLR